MICTKPMNGPCSTMYIAPRHIMVAASDKAECTALRRITMPSAPARAIGPRIQNETASPSGTSPCISGLAASMSALAMVTPHLDRPAGNRLAGDVGRALRLTLLQRCLRCDGVVRLLGIAQAHRVRRRFHAGQQRR